MSTKFAAKKSKSVWDLFSTPVLALFALVLILPAAIVLSMSPTSLPSQASTLTPSPSPATLLPLRNPSFEINANKDQFPDNWSLTGVVNPMDGKTNAMTDGVYAYQIIGPGFGKTKALTSSTVTGQWSAGTRLQLDFYTFVHSPRQSEGKTPANVIISLLARDSSNIWKTYNYVLPTTLTPTEQFDGVLKVPLTLTQPTNALIVKFTNGNNIGSMVIDNVHLQVLK